MKINLSDTKQARLYKQRNPIVSSYARTIKFNNFLIKILRRGGKNIGDPKGLTYDAIQGLFLTNKRLRGKLK